MINTNKWIKRKKKRMIRNSQDLYKLKQQMVKKEMVESFLKLVIQLFVIILENQRAGKYLTQVVKKIDL